MKNTVTDVRYNALFAGTITAESAGIGITLIWGNESTLYNERKTSLHSHMSHEIYGLLSGSALVETAGDTIELSAGEIAIIPPHVYHSISNLSESFELLALDFKLFKNEQPKNDEEVRIHKTVEAMNGTEIVVLNNQPDILYTITSLDRLANTPMLADVYLARAYTEALLLHLVRAFELVSKDEAHRTVDFHKKHVATAVQLERMIIIEDYFTNKYANATMDELADELCLSKQHVRRFLRSNYNMSFSDLLSKYRISACQRMLRETRKSITEIWNLAGYNSAQNFSVAFRKYTGCSPSQYRSRYLL